MNSVLYYPDLCFVINSSPTPPASKKIAQQLILAVRPFLDLLSSEESCLAQDHTLSQKQTTTEQGSKMSGKSLRVLKLTLFIPGNMNLTQTQDEINAVNTG